MEGTVMTTLLMLNTNSGNNTSVRDVIDHSNYASAYLDNDVTNTLWLIVPPVLLVLGSYSNVMVVLVMRGLRDSDSTACLSVYFTALAVSDLVVLWTAFMYYWPEYAINVPLIYFHDLSCSLPLFVFYVSSLTSAWFLVAMTCQRLTSVVLPHRVGVLCTVRRGKIVVATIVTIACLANIHFFFHYHIEHADDGSILCASNNIAASIFSFVDLCLASLVPFLILIVANRVLIYRTLQSIQMARKMTARDTQQTTSRSAKVSSMTVTLILTSAAFLVLTLPTCILNVYLEMIGFYNGDIDDEQLSETLALAETVCILLWMSNSAINFYIYILSGRRFRQEAQQYLRLCFKHPKRSPRSS